MQTPWISYLQATCRRSGLPVALKVYFLSRVPSNVLHMVVREIKIQSELTHKNIVGLYAAFQVWNQRVHEVELALGIVVLLAAVVWGLNAGRSATESCVPFVHLLLDAWQHCCKLVPAPSFAPQDERRLVLVQVRTRMGLII